MFADWQCTGGSASPGTAIEGFFTAQKDPCASALALSVTVFEELRGRPRPLVKATLLIDCSSRGGGGGGGGGPSAPTLTALRISPTTFKAAARGASVAAPVGARVSFTLTVGAKGTFAVERVLAGVNVGGRCVTPTNANRKRSHCTRFVKLGSFSRNGAKGANAFRFTGRLSGRKLAPGAYRLRASARAGSGPASAAVRSPQFHIVR
jgi:hypothetical protein